MAAKLRIRGEGINLVVQYNPTEYALAKTTKIEATETKGLNASELQFNRGENEKLTLTLLFDATLTGGDVRGPCDELRRLAQIIPGKDRIPIVTVTWGSALSFKAITDSVNRKFTLFDDAGKPLRATVTVSFREYKTKAELLAEIKGQASPHTRRWVVQRGDTLAGIAAEVLGDAAAWRWIADSNAERLPHPRHLEPGTVLIIPPWGP